jgi:hypothetical protein
MYICRCPVTEVAQLLRLGGYVLSLLYLDLELKDYLFVVSLLNPYLNSRCTLQSSYL